MSVNHMFYAEASERKRNKGEDQEIMSEFFAVCTGRLSLLISQQYLWFSVYGSLTSARRERGDRQSNKILFQNFISTN